MKYKYMCDKCGAIFKTKEGLELHNKLYHSK
jgi:rubredoxin